MLKKSRQEVYKVGKLVGLRKAGEKGLRRVVSNSMLDCQRVTGQRHQDISSVFGTLSGVVRSCLLLYLTGWDRSNILPWGRDKDHLFLLLVNLILSDFVALMVAQWIYLALEDKGGLSCPLEILDRVRGKVIVDSYGSRQFWVFAWNVLKLWRERYPGHQKPGYLYSSKKASDSQDIPVGGRALRESYPASWEPGYTYNSEGKGILAHLYSFHSKSKWSRHLRSDTCPGEGGRQVVRAGKEKRKCLSRTAHSVAPWRALQKYAQVKGSQKWIVDFFLLDKRLKPTEALEREQILSLGDKCYGVWSGW